tara:strand:- start:910 stop:1212 length:303 start_codon:yes stop_codon:yes gene_type:complete
MAAIFIFSWLILLVFAVRLIFKGWSAASELGGRQYVDEGTRYVTRVQHPEMAEVKPGDELMVVNFKKPPSQDPLLRSLENRIDELESEDDDDDGDIVIRA